MANEYSMDSKPWFKGSNISFVIAVMFIYSWFEKLTLNVNKNVDLGQQESDWFEQISEGS